MIETSRVWAGKGATATPLRWSRADARRFLANYHFSQGSLTEVLGRLGSVQYDPLRPVGRNHDLVLQARVPAYRVDDWEVAAYEDRVLYDAWDKQACLVPPSDWPFRSIYHDYFRKAWSKRVLEPYAAQVERTLRELEERGPLSSLDFEDQSRVDAWSGSWYGPKLVKQILRALWDSGQVVTHHRVNGRHVYGLPESVIPAGYLEAPPASRRESMRFVILRRHQSVGLLSPVADWAVWGMRVSAAERREVIDELVRDGELVPVEVDGDRYYVRAEDLPWAEVPRPEPRMVFVAPLDAIMWDRRAVSRIFGFDYVWEVYKPERERRWGYYVLPVFHGDEFVARTEARLDGAVLRIERWWWEEGVHVGAGLLEDFAAAAQRFRDYAGARKVRLGRRMARETRRELAAALEAIE